MRSEVAKMAMQGVLLLSIVAALLSVAATAASTRGRRLPPSALDKFTQSKGHWNRGMGPREVKNGWIDTRKTGNSGDWPAVDDHENDLIHKGITDDKETHMSRMMEEKEAALRARLIYEEMIKRKQKAENKVTTDIHSIGRVRKQTGNQQKQNQPIIVQQPKYHLPQPLTKQR